MSAIARLTQPARMLKEQSLILTTRERKELVLSDIWVYFGLILSRAPKSEVLGILCNLSTFSPSSTAAFLERFRREELMVQTICSSIWVSFRYTHNLHALHCYLRHDWFALVLEKSVCDRPSLSLPRSST